MKNIYRKPWFRLLPIVVLIIFLLVDILRLFTPSGGAAGTGFSIYHDSYYGYSINYPSTWKITHIPAHTSEFVAPGSTATCQVSVNVTREAMIPQKALLSIVPRGAYSVSHRTIDGSPAIAFSQYSSRIQSANGYTSASTKKVVVAQSNTAHKVNLYTLSLDLFRAAFVRHNNVEPHTACESNFQMMVNSLVLGKDIQAGVVSPASGNIIDTSNPAVNYAENTWNWWDSSGNCCAKQLDAQTNFECAEFVARALSTEGFMFGLDTHSLQTSYGNYFGYDLLNVGDKDAT